MANPYQKGYIISQRFGCTGVEAEPPYQGCPHFHKGIDLVSAPANTPIYATTPQVVEATGQDITGAKFVLCRDDAGRHHIYYHLSAISVRPGQRVDNNTQVGLQGSTGNSTGNHLHYAVYEPGVWTGTESGTPIDPKPFLEGGNDMDTAKVVDDLVRRLTGIEPQKYGARQEKINYLNAGGDVGTLANDLIRSKTLYFADDTLANEIHIAGYGKPAEQWWIDQKSAAMGAGFPPSQLILEVMPGGDQQAAINLALEEIDKAESILRAA